MGRLVAFCTVLLLGGSGCGLDFEGLDPNTPQPTQVTKEGDALVISSGDPNYSKFERPESDDECASELDCSSAGCSAEVCTTSAQAPEVYTQCIEVHPGRAFFCTCLQKRCRWQKDPEYTD